jgi:hypothetical protein
MRRLLAYILFFLILSVSLATEDGNGGKKKNDPTTGPVQPPKHVQAIMRRIRDGVQAMPPRFIPIHGYTNPLSDVDIFFAPAIMFFDPIGQLGATPLCPDCNHTLTRAPADSSWATYLVVYHTTGIQFVQAYNYQCPNTTCQRSTVRSTRTEHDSLSASFLALTPTKGYALTHQLQQMMMVHIFTGQSFEAFATSLRSTFAYHHAILLNQWECYQRSRGVIPSTSPWVLALGRTYPSSQNLREAFYYSYARFAPFYTRSMSSLTNGSNLAANHTYKSAVNLGFWSWDQAIQKHRWVRQYVALYIVLNHKKQVLTWCFCESHTLKEVGPFLHRLGMRIARADSCIQTFVTDNCCKERAFLVQLFPGIKVYLDSFHFIQRLSRALNRQSAGGWEAARQLKGLLADLPGPGPEEVRAAIHLRLNAWVALCITLGVCTLKVTRAVANGRLHVNKGCLDVVSQGTQANENLHRWCKRLSHARQGVALAMALFTMYFHFRNCDIDKQQILHRYPHQAPGPLPETSEFFGISRRAAHHPLTPTPCNTTDVNPEAPGPSVAPTDANASGPRMQYELNTLINDLCCDLPTPLLAGDDQGLRIVPIPTDGYCLYTALQVVMPSAGTMENIRDGVMAEFRAHPNTYAGILDPLEGSYEEQVARLLTPGGWQTAIGYAAPQATANALGVILVVHTRRGEIIYEPREWRGADPVHLYNNGVHFDAILGAPERLSPFLPLPLPDRARRGVLYKLRLKCLMLELLDGHQHPETSC